MCIVCVLYVCVLCVCVCMYVYCVCLCISYKVCVILLLDYIVNAYKSLVHTLWKSSDLKTQYSLRLQVKRLKVTGWEVTEGDLHTTESDTRDGFTILGFLKHVLLHLFCVKWYTQDDNIR